MSDKIDRKPLILPTPEVDYGRADVFKYKGRRVVQVFYKPVYCVMDADGEPEHIAAKLEQVKAYINRGVK